MKIITKYYDDSGKLKVLKGDNLDKDKSVIRFKVLKGKEYPCSDYHGKCTNYAYAEVFPIFLKGKKHKKGWSYLCKKHYYEEQMRLKWKLPACLSVKW